MKHKIKGDITSWNGSIYDFNSKMRNVKDDEDIELEINSYGGDVFAGIDIMNTLRGHKGNVTITITGIAASAASIIAMGANKIKMYANTQLMVHNAWTMVAGNAKQLRKVADVLDSIGESVLASYTHRVDAKTVKKLLDEETYLSAAKAKELGFIDEIVEGTAEAVESEVFQDKATEFNNALGSNDSKENEYITKNELKAYFDELKGTIQNTQKDDKTLETPAPVAASKRRVIF
ncbi:head maturation protease, ClpP-related [Kurthia populi]|uniref:ATP-dependent Clp protease proteolytic subunit n=1 Tax=Kurthia populi TaxID=1562132 RepID=A0ABW5Y4H4_9BACL